MAKLFQKFLGPKTDAIVEQPLKRKEKEKRKIEKIFNFIFFLNFFILLR